MSETTDNIISRLSTRFTNACASKEKPDYLTRDMGGHFRNNQPFISGYYQVVFGLPTMLFNSSAAEVQKASQWLHSTCETFTPHSQTLNKEDLLGQGQIGSSFVTSVTTNREISFAFREYQNQPILNIIRKWASVFDPFTGVSPLSGNTFIPSNYKGWVAVIQTKPVRANNNDIQKEDIEEAYIYSGVFPTTIPVDTAAAADITSNAMVQLSVTFSFDNAPLTTAEPGVLDKVFALFSNMKYIGQGGNDTNSTFNRYDSNIANMTQWGGVAGGTTDVSSDMSGSTFNPLGVIMPPGVGQ